LGGDLPNETTVIASEAWRSNGLRASAPVDRHASLAMTGFERGLASEKA
jgi:hypothetical protein